MARLASRHCTTLKKGTKPMRESLAHSLLSQLHPEWRLSKNKQAIERTFKFANFQETVGFINAIAWIANRENHHPDLQAGYNRCEVSYTSHIASGLTVNDFICASKIDLLLRKELSAHAEPEPAHKVETGKPATATKSEPELKFDAAEADALLKKAIPPKQPPPAASSDEEDEFKLIDPDQLSEKHEAVAAAVESAKSDTGGKQEAESAESSHPGNANTAGNAKKEQPPKPAAGQQPEKPSTTPLSTSGTLIDPKLGGAPDSIETPTAAQPEVDLMATVILPPGMESISEPNETDADEDDSTVILHDTTATAEIDDKTINILPGEDDQQSKSATQDTFIKQPPAAAEESKKAINAGSDTATDGNNEATTTSPDKDAQQPAVEDLFERTMILAPEQVEQISEAVKTGENKTESDETSEDEEDDTEKTMILTSNPTQAIRHPKEPPATESAKPEDQKTPPPAQSTTPAEKETSTERTLTLSSDPTHAIKRQSTQEEEKEKKPAEQQSDPGIEDDETLVMHSNTYKPVNSDRK